MKKPRKTVRLLAPDRTWVEIYEDDTPDEFWRKLREKFGAEWCRRLAVGILEAK